MLASELRQQLFDLIEEHGDLHVVDDLDNDLDIEYNDNGTGDDPVFVMV